MTEERIPEDVLYALRGLNAEFHGKKDPIVTGAFLQLLLGRLLPQLCLDPVSEDPNSSMIYRLIRYISMHFSEPLTLDMLEKELGVGKYYLSRIFSQKLGTNFREYLNSLRLRYAADLLETTDHMIGDICRDAGFENQRTFNRTFQQHYGVTPSEYRKKQYALSAEERFYAAPVIDV